ncbi:MAG TPA: magnesium/cobalt transporter CorA [Chloroflexia bacterium]|nr:magnesium/cobalt transporter CorA [Chloroflexia bacterium]
MRQQGNGARPRPTNPTTQQIKPADFNGTDGKQTHDVAEPVVPMPAASARTRPKSAAPATAVQRTLNIQTISHNDITWVNLVHPGEAEIEWLQKTYGFHPLHLDDTLSKIQRPKIDDEDNYTFIVMHFPVYSKLVGVTISSEVDIFVGANFIITAHAGNLKPLTRLFKQCVEDPDLRAKAMGRSTGYLLYIIVDRLVDYCFPILNKIDLNIEHVEDDIFEEQARQTIQQISVIRRDVIAFRRIIKPLMPVMASLERKNRPFLNEDMEDYFGDIADHLGKIWDTLEDYKEVIESLSDTMSALTNNRINEIIKVLTIISVILLPLTLISGIYGMNINLPVANNPLAFEIVLGSMIIVVAAMLAFFRWRKWI